MTETLGIVVGIVWIQKVAAYESMNSEMEGFLWLRL
jgi:hypothetical protein